LKVQFSNLWTVVVHFLCLLCLVCFFPLAVLIAISPLTPARICRSNLSKQLKINHTKTIALTSRLFLNYSVYFLETAIVRTFGAEKIVNLNELISFLQDCKAKFGAERGFIFLSAHMSNIEAAGEALKNACQAAGVGTYVALAKPSRSGAVQKFLSWMRLRRGLRILWTDRKDLLREMLKTCQQGNSLGFLVDQKPSSGGIFVRFFEDWAAFPVAGPELGIRTGLVFLHVCAVRTGVGTFKMVFAEGDNTHLGYEPYLASNEVFRLGLNSKEIKVAPVLALYVCWLQELVSLNPSQWFWDYRKWSRQPHNGHRTQGHNNHA
jgi:lauroyl/myristoyl acyltransferase